MMFKLATHLRPKLKVSTDESSVRLIASRKVGQHCWAFPTHSRINLVLIRSTTGQAYTPLQLADDAKRRQTFEKISQNLHKYVSKSRKHGPNSPKLCRKSLESSEFPEKFKIYCIFQNFTTILPKTCNGLTELDKIFKFFTFLLYSRNFPQFTEIRKEFLKKKCLKFNLGLGLRLGPWFLTQISKQAFGEHSKRNIHSPWVNIGRFERPRPQQIQFKPI